MKEAQPLTQLALKAVALAMGVAAVVLSILGTVPLQTNVMLLGIGLAVLAIAVLGQSEE
jgi:hypothetical protein